MKSNMRTNIIAKLELDGIHNWPDAHHIAPEVGFLSNMHRHKWYITAKKQVHHDDRDVEFIMFKRDIEEYLRSNFYSHTARTHEFGSTSCEMLAREILEQFDCCYVSVFEDNENGAEIILENTKKEK